MLKSIAPWDELEALGWMAHNGIRNVLKQTYCRREMCVALFYCFSYKVVSCIDVARVTTTSEIV